jgi:hypothetical protein
MYDVLTMHVFKSLGYLPGKLLNQVNIELFLLVRLEQLSLLAVLHQQIKVGSVPEALEQLNNVPVLDCMVQNDLRDQIVQVALRLDLLGVDNLQGGKVALFPVFDLVYETVGPSADYFRAKIIFLES